MIKYTINIAAITLKNFSADFKIFSICFLSFFAIGPYKADFITGPIPASNRVIYAKNCVIDETSPLTFEPNFSIIILGTMKPQINVVTCNSNDEIIFKIAFLLLNFLSPVLIYSVSF